MIEYMLEERAFLMHLFSGNRQKSMLTQSCRWPPRRKVEDIVPAAARRFCGPARRSHAFLLSVI